MPKNPELNKTEFAVIIGLVREKWNFLIQHVGDVKRIEAFKGSDKLVIDVVGMKTTAALNGVAVSQRHVRFIIEGRSDHEHAKPKEHPATDV